MDGVFGFSFPGVRRRIVPAVVPIAWIVLSGLSVAAPAPDPAPPGADLRLPASIGLAQDPRYTAALADMTTLRDAEELTAVDTLYYTSLENLDDLPGINSTVPHDGILDQGGAWMLDPDTGDWLSTRQHLDQAPFVWGGPYAAFQRKAGDTDLTYDPGTPTDPWGQPYWLFSPLGLARPTIPAITLEYYGDQFDRWWIVSFGADGVMSSDDVGVSFGMAPTRLVISRAQVVSQGQPLAAPSAPTLPVGVHAAVSAAGSWYVRIKGYNFGSTQQSSTVSLDGQPLADPASYWSSNEVFQPLPMNLPMGTHTVRLSVGLNTSKVFPFLFPSDLAPASPHWTLYE